MHISSTLYLQHRTGMDHGQRLLLLSLLLVMLVMLLLMLLMQLDNQVMDWTF